jgi:anti-anti-sigma factor
MLEIRLRKEKAIMIFDLSGAIDIDAANFIEKIGWCLNNGYKDIACNFQDVSMMDYPGLTVLTIAYKNVLNHQGRMKLFSIAAHLKKVLCLVYLDRVLDVYDSFEAVLKSFEEDRSFSEIQKKKLRRRFKRLPLDIHMELKSKMREEEFIRGKVFNISAVGLLVFADKNYPLGELMRVKLSLIPSPGLVELDCKVAWLVQKELQPQLYPGMGLEFYKLDNQTQKKIMEFVERNLPLSCSNE